MRGNINRGVPGLLRQLPVRLRVVMDGIAPRYPLCTIAIRNDIQHRGGEACGASKHITTEHNKKLVQDRDSLFTPKSNPSTESTSSTMLLGMLRAALVVLLVAEEGLAPTSAAAAAGGGCTATSVWPDGTTIER